MEIIQRVTKRLILVTVFHCLMPGVDVEHQHQVLCESALDGEQGWVGITWNR